MTFCRGHREGRSCCSRRILIKNNMSTHVVDTNFREALVRAEQTTCETVADVNLLVMEILTKKVPFEHTQTYSQSHIEIYGDGPSHLCLSLPEYNDPMFRASVHKLLKKLYTLKRTFTRKEKYGLHKQQHRDSGFDQVCEEILYMPGLGEGYMVARANFAHFASR